MKKLITGAIVAAALAVPATPAFAIHDPNVPAGDDANKACSAAPSQAVGDPSRRTDHGNQSQPNTTFSNGILALHNTADPPCHNDPDPTL